ncbi:MAG: hypothetical protein GYB66_02760, partial [Chloroflexi bacterium]|nr:hypothetical protein [Chloroflexota bacterium]
RYTLAAYEADTLEQATGDDEDTENAEPLERLSAIEVENNANLLWVLTADTRGERVRPRNVFLEVDNRPSFGSPRAIGETLFTSYLLPFEMIGLLLLISMVGVIVLTKEAERLVRRRTGVRRMATVPGNPTVEEYVKALKAGQPIPEEYIKQLPGPSESSGD